jgi:hypothetical protein
MEHDELTWIGRVAQERLKVLGARSCREIANLHGECKCKFKQGRVHDCGVRF